MTTNPTTTPEAAERARFEAWAGEKGYVTTLSVHVRYRTFVSRSTECAWIGWQARAALAAQEGGGERVTLEGWLDQPIQQELSFPGVKFGKGVSLRTVLKAATRWKTIADKAQQAQMPSDAAEQMQGIIRTAQEGTGNG